MGDDLAIGIDIGASKIVVAVCRDGKAEVVLNHEGCRSSQFCVAFNNKERLFGVAAEGQFSANPENTIFGRDVKKIIGLRKSDMEDKVSMAGFPLRLEGSSDNLRFVVEYKNHRTHLYPEHILTMILKKIKDDIELALRAKVSQAVITVPSMFNSAQRFAIRNAFFAAGINVKSIINDSTAAAITYGVERHGSGDKNILVFDMGASSTDISVVRLSGNSIEVKSCGGSLDLGGDSFDMRLVEHFIYEFQTANRCHISDDKKIIARLRVACEKFKKILSATNEGSYFIESFYHGEQYQLKMTRSTFELLCEKLFEKLKNVINNVICHERYIDDIIVVGNGSRIPKIEKILSNFKEISKVLNYDESVAMGAAYLAARENSKSYRIQRLIVKQVTAMPIKIQLGANGTLTVVKEGKSLPFEKEETYEYEGICPLLFIEGNYILSAKRNFSGDIFTEIDENGLIKIRLSGTDHEMITNHQKLNEPKTKEIQVIEDVFKKDEREYKKIMELRNEVEKLCLGYKRSVNFKDLKDILNDEEKSHIVQLCKRTLDYLDDCEYPKIDDLERKLKSVKEKYEECISKAKLRSELDHAMLLFNEKNYEQANSLFLHILNNFRNNLDHTQKLEIIFKRADSLFAMEKFFECIKFLDKITNFLDPDDENLLCAMRLRGMCHFEVKNFAKCISDLDCVLKFESDPELQSIRDTAEDEKNSSDVEKTIKDSEKLFNNRKYFDSNKQLTDLVKTEEFAKVSFKKPAIKGIVYTLLAKNNFKLENYSRVLENCKLAENFSDNPVDLWELQAEANLELNRLSDAESNIQVLETVTDYKKGSFNNLKRKLGGKLFEIKVEEYEKKIKTEEYQSALNLLDQINPENLEKKYKIDYFCKKAFVSMKLEKYTDGIDCCNNVLKIENKHLEAFQLRAQLNFAMKEYQKTIDDCNLAIKCNPSETRDIHRLKYEAERALENKMKEKQKLKKGYVENFLDKVGSVFRGSSSNNGQEKPSKLEKEFNDLKRLDETSDDSDSIPPTKENEPNFMKETESSKNKKVKTETEPPRRRSKRVQKETNYYY